MERRFFDLDGLRGIAVLAVMLAHYVGEAPHGLPPLRAGWLGVDFFFVLSGFLVGGILIDHRDNPRYFSAFYGRRALRIFPAYYAMLALCLPAIAALATRPWVDAPMPTISYLAYLQNFAMTISGQTGSAWLLPTWTLAVEEQFYWLLPLALAFWPARSVSLAAILVAPIFRAICLGAHGELAALTLLPSQFDLLFFGVLAADIYRNGRDERMMAYARAGFLIGGFGLALSTIGTHISAIPFYVVIGPSCAGLCFASYILGLRWGIFDRTKYEPRWLRFFGAISYGLYLIHQPINGLLHGLLLSQRPDVENGSQMLVTAIAATISIAVAAISWRYFERPLVRLGHRLFVYDDDFSRGDSYRLQQRSENRV